MVLLLKCQKVLRILNDSSKWEMNYQCRFRSFWCVASCGVDTVNGHDDPRICCGDAFDAIDAVMPAKPPDVAYLKRIFSSWVTNCLCLYFSMTSQSSVLAPASHSSMGRLCKQREKKHSNQQPSYHGRLSQSINSCRKLVIIVAANKMKVQARKCSESIIL